MRSTLILTALILLMLMPIGPAFSAAVVGGSLGVNVENIRDPGGALYLGFQERLGDLDIVRGIYQSVNFGNNEYDNVAAMEIHYFNAGASWDIGTRLTADYEVQSSDIGLAVGVEFIKKDLVKGKIDLYLSADAVKKQDLDTYFQFGLGLILFPQME